ncbi:pilus assembly protein PilP [Francisella philomiragia]|uniref:Pilus assembly, PilP family protein n=1 Tax=Francisella philomiragia TaxID=28110 RepID=A0A0B6D207_9GAMM|nr:pilus assembly protein PilP [Francisella philomiragia]AJI52357.1 pilus assembly, PilP family protein [Francisella philomiragia]MBY7733729.1 pilus assembly protein PilP [Francisella philomiragia]
MNKYQRLKLLCLMLMITSYSYCYASYETRIDQVNQLIQNSTKSMKSSEKLDIPEYKGDTLTFERLSKIRNVFNIDHTLPFEKRVPIKGVKQKQEVVKLKPIIIPEELKEVMNTKPTSLQQYPLSSFKFKGTVSQNNQRWGVVESSMETKPIYVKEGELIGQNYGKVETITKEGIVVDEWKKDDQKRVWQKTPVVIH